MFASYRTAFLSAVGLPLWRNRDTVKTNSPFVKSFPRLLTTRRLIILGLSVPVLLLFLVGCLQWRSAHDFRVSREGVAQSRDLQQNLESFLSLMKDAETGQRGFILTHKESYLVPYYDAVAASHDQLQVLGKLAADNPEQKLNFDKLGNLMDTRLNELAMTIYMEKHKNHKVAMSVVQSDYGQNTMDQIRATVAKMQGIEASRLQLREDGYQRNSQINFALSGILIVLGLGFIVATGLLLRRMEIMQSMITICAWSKLIEYEGEWLSVEQYLSRRLSARVTHGISRAEAEKVLKLLEEEKMKKVA